MPADSPRIVLCMSDDNVAHSRGMRVIHDGPRQAPPVLLIHGSGASATFWGPVAGLLAGHHHVIRIDLPGCGQSPPAGSFDVPAQAGRVAALLDDLGLRHITVAGHSSGGYVGTELATQRPDLVGSLALISTGPSLDALLPQPSIVQALLAPPLGPLLWHRRSDAAIRKGIHSLAARPVDIPDGAITDLKNTPYQAFREVLRCNTEYLAEQAMPERLAGLGLPLLVIFGAADPRYDPSSAQQYNAVPNSRVEMLPGVGHLPILEAPEPTSELLMGFTATANATDTDTSR